MKMDYINPEAGRYQFAATDNLVAFAKQNDMEVHAHPLIWYSQVPAWIELSPLADRETHMVDFISRIMARYGNDISIWDVVNEPMDDDGSLDVYITELDVSIDGSDSEARQADVYCEIMSICLEQESCKSFQM